MNRGCFLKVLSCMDTKVTKLINQFTDIDIKKVSDLVKTRSIDQVRSHLQKHQLKEKKLKEKKNLMSNNKITIQDINTNLD